MHAQDSHERFSMSVAFEDTSRGPRARVILSTKSEISLLLRGLSWFIKKATLDRMAVANFQKPDIVSKGEANPLILVDRD